MRQKPFAVINIGSSAFRMQISDFSTGKHVLLEYLIKSLPLGKDTFKKGYINLETTKKSVEILKKFQNKLTEYKINRFVAVATSGVREAINRDFFIDYIFKNTGIEIKVLDPYEEMFIRYTAFINETEDISKLEKKGLIFANVSSGNVSLTVNMDKSITYSEALPFGSLRLNEIFSDLPESEKTHAFKVYIDNMLSEAKKVLSKEKPKVVFFTGSTVNVLKYIFEPKKAELKITDLKELLTKIELFTPEMISKELNLRMNEAEIIKAVLMSYLRILNISGQNRFYFSSTSFPHKLVMYFANKYKNKNLKVYLQHTLIHYGNKYNFDKNHALRVRYNTKKLFTELKDIHNIPINYLKILDIAAITHDFGYFINPANHEYNSYHILKSMHLPGVSEKEMDIASLIVLMHRGYNVEYFKEYFTYNIDLFLIKKLVALFRVADALDASHKQIVKDFKIDKSTDKVKIIAFVTDFIYLEKLSFDKKSQLFENVFGVKVELEEIPFT